ncbi:MAG: hypothetical protein ABGW69_02375 [Nanoarchaeota archaeon]
MESEKLILIKKDLELFHLLFRLNENRANLYEKVQDTVLRGEKDKVAEELAESLSDFLKNWNKARMYNKEELRKIFVQILDEFGKFKLLKLSKKAILDNLSKEDKILIENIALNIVFLKLKELKNSIEKVATSKVLNVLFPQIFPLFDNEILKALNLNDKIENEEQLKDLFNKLKQKYDNLRNEVFEEELKKEEMFYVGGRLYSHYKLIDEILYLLLVKKDTLKEIDYLNEKTKENLLNKAEKLLELLKQC